MKSQVANNVSKVIERGEKVESLEERAGDQSIILQHLCE